MHAPHGLLVLKWFMTHHKHIFAHDKTRGSGVKQKDFWHRENLLETTRFCFKQATNELCANEMKGLK